MLGMYCLTFRELGRFPWQHASECVDGLRQRVRLYEALLPWLAMLLVGETVLGVVAFVLLGRVI